jgi:endonuclease IV
VSTETQNHQQQIAEQIEQERLQRIADGLNEMFAKKPKQQIYAAEVVAAQTNNKENNNDTNEPGR